MPALKILCLHGAGMNSEIMKSHLSYLTKILEERNIAQFEYAEGSVETEPGPGITPGLYEGPYYSFFTWPPKVGNLQDEESVQNAYEELLEVIDEEGPFDGLLGFSHGGSFLAELLAGYAREKTGSEVERLARCAIFINSFPPFRMDPEQNPIIDYELLKSFPKIPTLHIIGMSDFVHEYSTILYKELHQRAPTSTILVPHPKGHEIPRDPSIAKNIIAGFEALNLAVSFNH
ncbi:serine hydrolase FSH [Xylogone sp. PMI_703]|nr:serine hydrolase FSH [Xylogone sp. PMI_703]